MGYLACLSLCLCMALSYIVIVTGHVFHISQGQVQCSCDFINSTSTLSIKCNNSMSHDEVTECFKTHSSTQYLYFTDSSLVSIPSEISTLDHLKHLDLSRNRIPSMDLNPIKHVCRNLETLVLDVNDIHKLNKGSMNCLKSLVMFSIANNSLWMIENGTFTDHLRRLKTVNLMYNRLTSLDTSIIYLPSLVTGNISITVNATWNRVRQLTNFRNVSIVDIKQSYSFDVVLTHNDFTSINIKYYLKMFYITNSIQFYNLWNSGIDLRFNPFICDCSMEPIADLFRIFRPIDPDNPVFSITCQTPSSLSGMMIYKVPQDQFNCSVTADCPKDCSCVETVKLQLMTVTCSNQYLSPTLPDNVPNFEAIHISIKSATLTRLSSRHYLTNTTLLDVSGCSLDTISDGILTQLATIQMVYLHDNNMMALPRDIEKVKFDGLNVMTLRGNPFTCDCHCLWLKQWLIRNKPYIKDVTRVLCGSGPGKGKPVIYVKDSNFKCEYHITINEVLIIVFSIAFLLIVMFVLAHYHRSNIQVFLIAYFNIYCFRKKAVGDFPYDVFISHSRKDDDWVLGHLLKGLENQKPPYKVIFDERDFQLGKTIVFNVDRAIRSSRTTLLVLTNNFLRSDWCMMEFKQAHLKLLKDKDINFIVIVKEELNQSLMGEELQFYLHTNVFIKYRDKYFWPKLLQALPMAPLQSSISESSPLIVNS